MPFNSKAYHAKDEYGEFIDITDEDLKGHWSAIVFYPADLLLYAQLSLVTLQTTMKS